MRKTPIIFQHLNFNQDNLKHFLDNTYKIKESIENDYLKFIDDLILFEETYPNFIKQVFINKIFFKYEYLDGQLEIILGKGSYIPLFLYIYFNKSAKYYSVRVQFEYKDLNEVEDIIGEGGYCIYE